MKRIYVLLAVIALVAFMPAGRAAADSDRGLQAVPFEYVGKAGDCGTGYPAGSRIVTAAWLGGMGLPDNGGDSALNGLPATRNDPHSGLLVSKNGPTPDCSSSGAEIQGVKGMSAGSLTAPFVLGFDYRNGGHCGAGAPRFNVVTRKNGVDTFHFVGGCASGVTTPAPQDLLQWSRVRFALAGATDFPATEPGSTIVSIDLMYDEGTDTISAQDPMGVGLAVIDNIFINGQYIRSGPRDGRGDGNGKDKDKKDKGDDEDEDDD